MHNCVAKMVSSTNWSKIDPYLYDRLEKLHIDNQRYEVLKTFLLDINTSRMIDYFYFFWYMTKYLKN